MKILTLHLAAFGPFTDRELTLPATGLTLVYGNNEAGKSSALRALEGLFFGIPAGTTDNFLHANPQLRVGGVIRCRDGRELTISRRKGRTNTLLSVDQQTIETDFAECLGGVGLQLFQEFFGLDHPRLVAGGREMVRGGGALGSSLFEAGTGLVGWRQRILGLEAEADKLFVPRGRNPVLNQALDRLQEVRRQLRESAISGGEWNERRLRLASLEAKWELVNQEMAAQREHAMRQRRWEKAAPLAVRWRQVGQELEALKNTALLAEDADSQRLTALHGLEEAQRMQQRIESRLEELQVARQTRGDGSRWLARQTAIEGVLERLGGWRSALEKLPQLQAEGQGLLESMARQGAAIDPERSPEALLALRVAIPVKEGIRQLQEQYPLLGERLAGEELRHAEAVRALEQVEDRLKILPPTIAWEGWQGVLEEAERAGDLEKRWQDAHLRSQRLRHETETELATLGCWPGGLADLMVAPLPLVETIDWFEGEWRERLLRRDRLAEARTRQVTEREGLGREQDRLRRQGAVPTDADLQQARQERERLWQEVRQSWSRGGFAPELARAFEGAMAMGDGVADRLRREADRVAEWANVQAAIQAMTAQDADLERQQEAWELEMAALRRNWSAQWQSAGITPLSPLEMRGWLGKWRALQAKYLAMVEAEQEAESFRLDLERYRAALLQAWPTALPDLASDAPWSMWLARAKRDLAGWRGTAETRRQLERETSELATRVAKSQRQEGRLRQEMVTWQRAWEEAIQPLGLPITVAPTAVALILDELAALQRNGERIRQLQREAAILQAEIQGFGVDLAGLSDALIPEWSCNAPSEQADRLRQGLAMALADQQQGILLDSEKAKLEAERIHWQEVREGKMDLLRLLLADAGCSQLSDLAEALRRSTEKRGLQHRLRDLAGQLADLSDGQPFTEFLEELAGAPMEGIGDRIAAMEQRIAELDGERSGLDRAIGEERQLLARLHNSDATTADLGEEAQEWIATIRELVACYLRLQLEATLAKRAVESYRQRQQGPLLTAAAEYFRRITLNSFAGLGVDYDDKDQPILVGQRPTGALVPLVGMSSGAADQLFLALRLAAIEQRLREHGPIPLLLDDILVHFDDDRSRATLACLGELAGSTQILYFTHHARIRELARQAVPAERLHEIEL